MQFFPIAVEQGGRNSFSCSCIILSLYLQRLKLRKLNLALNLLGMGSMVKARKWNYIANVRSYEKCNRL